MPKNSVDIVLQAYDRSTKTFGSVENAFAKMTRNIAASIGAYFGARSIINFAFGSIREYADYETAFLKLAGGLASLGDKGGTMAYKMKASADELQRLSGIEGTAVLKSMALGAALGRLSGKDLLNATRAAIGWATILDKNVNETMLMVVKAANGNIQAFQRLGVRFQEGADAAANFNKVLAEGEKGFVLTQSLAETTSRKLEDLKNAWKDFQRLWGAEERGPINFLVGIATEELRKRAEGLPIGTPIGEDIIKYLRQKGLSRYQPPKEIAIPENIDLMGKYNSTIDENTDATAKAKKAIEGFDKELIKLAETVFKLKHGEEELVRLHFRLGGASREQIEKLVNLQKEEAHQKRIKKIEEERTRLAKERIKKIREAVEEHHKERIEAIKEGRERIRDAKKALKEEIETFGLDRFGKMLYELKQAGATYSQLSRLYPLIKELREKEKPETPGGWPLIESYTARGLVTGEVTRNYSAQTAANTKKQNELMERMLRILERKGITISPVDIN